MTIPPRAGWLLAGAAASFALVALHFGIIVAGPPAYAWFLAGDRMVALAEARSLIPTLVTGGVAAVFAVFGLYALAGAGVLRLPGAPVVVIVVGCIYTLRGVLIVPEWVMVRFLDRPARALIFFSS